MWDQRGEIKDQKGRNWHDITALDQGSQTIDHDQHYIFFFEGGDQAVPYSWDQGRKLATLLESRIRNLHTKVGSAMKNTPRYHPEIKQISSQTGVITGFQKKLLTLYLFAKPKNSKPGTKVLLIEKGETSQESMKTIVESHNIHI